MTMSEIENKWFPIAFDVSFDFLDEISIVFLSVILEKFSSLCLFLFFLEDCIPDDRDGILHWPYRFDNSYNSTVCFGAKPISQDTVT